MLIKEDTGVPAGLIEDSASAITWHTFRQTALSGLVLSPSDTAVTDDDDDGGDEDVMVLLRDKQNMFVAVL